MYWNDRFPKLLTFVLIQTEAVKLHKNFDYFEHSFHANKRNILGENPLFFKQRTQWRKPVSKQLESKRPATVSTKYTYTVPFSLQGVVDSCAGQASFFHRTNTFTLVLSDMLHRCDWFFELSKRKKEKKERENPSHWYSTKKIPANITKLLKVSDICTAIMKCLR